MLIASSSNESGLCKRVPFFPSQGYLPYSNRGFAQSGFGPWSAEVCSTVQLRQSKTGSCLPPYAAHKLCQLRTCFVCSSRFQQTWEMCGTDGCVPGVLADAALIYIFVWVNSPQMLQYIPVPQKNPAFGVIAPTCWLQLFHTGLNCIKEPLLKRTGLIWATVALTNQLQLRVKALHFYSSVNDSGSAELQYLTMAVLLQNLWELKPLFLGLLTVSKCKNLLRLQQIQGIHTYSHSSSADSW